MATLAQYLLSVDVWTLEEAVLVPPLTDPLLEFKVHLEDMGTLSSHDLNIVEARIHGARVFEEALRSVVAGSLPVRDDVVPGILPTSEYGRRYCVTPSDFIAWADRRGYPVDVTIRNALKPKTRSNPGAAAQKGKGERNREELLRAAFWCLAHHPEQCRRNGNGKVTAENVEAAVSLHAPQFWADTEEPPISGDRARRLYSKCLKGDPFTKGDSSGQTD